MCLTMPKSFEFYSSTSGMLDSVLDNAWQEMVSMSDPRVLEI